MSDDRQFLAEYCRTGSEAAFRELVDRHAGLVFSAAMRMVNGDAHSAQDIAQMVFANLARKASSLPRDVILAGWLHRDTRYTALEWLRRERRRIQRETEAAIMHEIHSGNEAPDWSSLRPVLDEALDELEDGDRHLLLLRFFEQRKLADVGATLGLAEDAARKRIVRALEKLRTGLAARGVTTTAAALSLALSTHGVESLPAGLTLQLTQGALATAGATTGSLVGTLALMTTAKSISIATAVALVVFLAGSKLHQSLSPAPPAESPSRSTQPGPTFQQPRTQPQPTRTGPAPRPGTDPANASALSAALARLREVLDDPKRGPNPALQEAINALGDQRKAAVPLLREALQSPSAQKRSRATLGLGMIGREAAEAAPDLMQALRESAFAGNAMEAANALQRMGPFPELLSDLTSILRENPLTRTILANALPDITQASATQLDAVIRPLLGDADPGVSQTAAYMLGMALRDQAGPGVVLATKAGLESTDAEVRQLALTALKNIGAKPTDPTGRVMADRLGAAAADLIPALVRIANDTGSKAHQHQALELLDAIQPGLRAGNIPMETLLSQREADAAFASQVRKGNVAFPELLRGVQEHPGALGTTAEALARLGPDAQEALPALQQALHSLEPRADASFADLAQALHLRTTVANAMQKIAPSAPKVLFTQEDMNAVFNALEEPLSAADAARRQEIVRTLQADVGDGPANRLERTPEQVRQLLESLRRVDPATAASLLKQVQKIDPRFAAQRLPDPAP